MKLQLQKGAKIDLTKGNPGLSSVVFGLGWDVSTDTVDLDATAILLNENVKQGGKPIGEVYFHNLTAPGVTHSGDNLTGMGDGDDESITVTMKSVAPEVKAVLFVVNIYEAQIRGQKFGRVNNAFIRAYNADKPAEEFGKYDLSEDYTSSTGVIMGQLYLRDGEWKFETIGKGIDGDLNEILDQLEIGSITF